MLDVHWVKTWDFEVFMLFQIEKWKGESGINSLAFSWD